MPARCAPRTPTRTTLRNAIAGVLAFLTAMAGMVIMATPASAAPVYEITGEWAPGTPTRTSNGNLVTAVWRVNVNDDQTAPANDPVPNVNFSVTAQHGKFAEIPTPCKTRGVTPVSSISANGATLVCNLGTVKEGTAEAVQGPMVVNGLSGQKISAVGTIDGHTATVPEIPISNVFKEDILWGTPSNQASYTRASAPTDVAFGLEWTLRTAPGSDPGPANVSYNVTITNSTNRNLTPGAPNINRASCTQYNYANPADGHPFSGRNVANENAPFVKTCTLTRVAGSTTAYKLTLTGIDYSKTLLPTKDSAGRPLPAAWQPVASGTIWLTMHNELARTSVNLHSSAPLYRSPSGKTFRDIDTSAAVTSNRTSKVLPLPGNWAASWARSFTGSGGTSWDNTYKLPVQTKVEAQVTDKYGKTAGVPNTALLGECAVLDTKYVTYFSSVAVKWQSPTGNTTPVPLAGAHFQYYTGAGDRSTNAKRLAPLNAAYNPNLFTCDGNVGWQNAKPGPGAIRAVRVTYRRSAVANYNAQLQVVERLRTTIPGTTPPRDVPVNQDVWMFGSTLQGWRNPHWVNPRRDTNNQANNQPVPGSRYHYTTGARDVLHIIGPTPIISKSASPRVVAAGEPATFTLNYHMEGSPGLRFNNVRIVDTLAPGETYVAGSASPAPTSAVGRTLTWVRSGVVSNALLKITYKATAAGAAGQALTNNVAMTYGNQTARASAQVTISTSGYTSILKSSDLQFIPNLNGDGSGTDSWTVTLTSNDPTPQTFTDTIDILPYNGDGRGTSFSGSYTLGEVTPPAGGTVYYTTADPSTLSDDPGDASNGTAGGPVSGIWSTTYTPNATAIRVLGPRLAPGTTQQFKVPITTADAESGDVYVNRAQARAQHTRLVMRTSAAMTMAQYYAATLKKYVQDVNGEWHDANGPADFPAFHYGDTIHYRVVVTNVGEGTITNIDVSDDKQPQLGAFHIDRLASGESQSHEYSITLDESQNGNVVNTACAKADTPPDMTTPPDIPCDPAGFKVTNYITEKTADPESGTAVEPGGVIHYTITVTQQGTEPADAMFSDDLTKVLDDADYNDDVQADIGTATFKESAINWSGTVPVGGVATVTYSVTVHDAAALAKHGDTDLYNPVTSPGCVPKDGEFPDCTTDHKTGYYTYAKVSDPASGSDVGATDTIKYTVTVTQQGEAAVPNAVVDDDMTEALDDATYNKDAKASAGTVSYAAPTLTWKGKLAVGQKVAITYTMTVNGKGDEKLANVVTNPPGTPGLCDTSIGCRTHHQYGSYTYSKVADPASGSTVAVGGKVTYTVTIAQHGPGSVPDATVDDDLSKVLDDATYDNDVHASSGVVTLILPKLTWKGDLAVGAKVRITYSVTVKTGGDGKLANVVTSPDRRGACDTTIGCETHHDVTSPPGGAGGLAFTGNHTRLELILAALLLAAGGALTVGGYRRRT